MSIKEAWIIFVFLLLLLQWWQHSTPQIIQLLIFVYHKWWYHLWLILPLQYSLTIVHREWSIHLYYNKIKTKILWWSTSTCVECLFANYGHLLDQKATTLFLTIVMFRHILTIVVQSCQFVCCCRRRRRRRHQRMEQQRLLMFTLLLPRFKLIRMQSTHTHIHTNSFMDGCKLVTY